MKIDHFSVEARAGLRRWACEALDDELAFDGIASLPEHWAWMWFLLREAEDRPEWFPKGKFATLQFLEQRLVEEARAEAAATAARGGKGEPAGKGEAGGHNHTGGKGRV